MTAEGQPGPIHVAVVDLGGTRVFARLDAGGGSDQPPEEVLAGQRVRLLVKDDGDHYFQVDRDTERSGLGALLARVRAVLS